MQATQSCLPAGMVAHGCQELAASAVQALATGAVFMYGALVASTVQTAHIVRNGARLYVFYVAAGTEWVWATTYATAGSAFAALRTATLLVGSLAGCWCCMQAASAVLSAQMQLTSGRQHSSTPLPCCAQWLAWRDI